MELVGCRCLFLPWSRVDVAELDACVVGGELPVDLALVGVDLVLPGGELTVQEFDIAKPPGEALPGQGGELDLGDVEPGSAPGRVVDLQALRQGMRLLGFKR